MLQQATVASMEKNVKRDLKPPYIGPLPGTKLKFRDALAQERPSPQQWPHRPYTELLQALPDLKIEVLGRHVASESVIVEVIINGTHLGPWRGLPATGRHLQFPLCGIYEFDDYDRLAAERIYYDRGAVLGQLGLFHEPVRGFGRVVTVLSHPWTIARACLRRPGQ